MRGHRYRTNTARISCTCSYSAIEQIGNVPASCTSAARTSTSNPYTVQAPGVDIAPCIICMSGEIVRYSVVRSISVRFSSNPSLTLSDDMQWQSYAYVTFYSLSEYQYGYFSCQPTGADRSLPKPVSASFRQSSVHAIRGMGNPISGGIARHKEAVSRRNFSNLQFEPRTFHISNEYGRHSSFSCCLVQHRTGSGTSKEGH